MAQVLSLNGTSIKQPQTGGFSIEKYRITKAGRVVSGDMVMENIARKRKFLFSYEVLSGTEYDTIADIIYGDSVFFTLSYVENGETKTAIVYAGALSGTQFRTDGPWYWRDVTFDLIER